MQLHKNKAIKAQFLHRRLTVSGSLQENILSLFVLLHAVGSIRGQISSLLDSNHARVAPEWNQTEAASHRLSQKGCFDLPLNPSSRRTWFLCNFRAKWQVMTTAVREASISSSMLDILSHESWSMHEKISAITIDEKRLDEGKSKRKLLSRAADWFLYPVYRPSLCRRTKGQNIRILYDRMLL